YIHIRKPSFSDAEMISYLQSIPQKYYNRLTLGSNFALINDFPLGGIHIKHNIEVKHCNGLRISQSCHSISEVASKSKSCDYVFLSPIFNSISKCGYNSNFSDHMLMEYAKTGLLNKVVALGGVDASNITKLNKYGFYGAAILGYLFADINEQEFTNRLKLIMSKV
ncbi:MAG: thiamine phosphate synthase, partial [Muribaculaceae bacterium]